MTHDPGQSSTATHRPTEGLRPFCLVTFEDPSVDGALGDMAALDTHGSNAAPPPPPQALRFASLDSGAAPLERLRSATAEALRRALAAVDASDYTLVLPHRLTTLLTHVFPHGLASLGKVTECVELTDELDKVHGTTVAYITLPQVEDVRAIATHAGLLLSVQQKERRFAIIVAGTWTALCAEVLEHQQLGEAFQVEEAEMGFVPLDNDLLTLGRERCLYDCFIHGNKSALVDMATALHQLQLLYGQFEHIKYKGDLAAFVFHQLMACELNEPLEPQQTKESATNKREKKSKKKSANTLHTLVILDRSVDYASALCTPLTLEALVDELFESRDGFATLSLATSSTADSHLHEQVLALNASDPIYSRVRGLNIQAVSHALNVEASAIKTKFDRFRATSASASTSEVHDFVKQVPNIKATQETLERLVSLNEIVDIATSSRSFRDLWQLERLILDVDPETDFTSVFEDIEDLIFRHQPLHVVLRLLCLYSVAHDGIPLDALQRLKMRLLQTYGHELIFSFDNLERLGLLRTAESHVSIGDVLWKEPSPSAFAEAAVTVKAIDSGVDVLDPSSMAFVTSGYAPISCRLVEEVLLRGSWEAWDSALNRLCGPRAEIERKVRKRTKKQTQEETDNDYGSKAAASTTKIQKRVLVVCIVGGVTYMEIAALRWLAQFYPTYEILIASTSIINGQSFLNDLLERIPSTT